MSKKFTLNQLTEGIRSRNVGQEGARLTEKWSRTGLLRGLEDTNRENMAVMLENQAAQLLRESNTMNAGGNVGGFTNIAFPIVRRVFGGLVANELVSIQPMSLPSGLLFYLDYTYGTDVGDTTGGVAYSSGDSIYNGPAGAGIQSGSLGSGGQYDLAGTGYSSGPMTHDAAVTVATILFNPDTTDHSRLAGFDQQLIDDAVDASDDENWTLIVVTAPSAHDLTRVKEMTIAGLSGDGTDDLGKEWQGGAACNLKRLNTMVSLKTGGTGTVVTDYVSDPFGGDSILMVARNATAATKVAVATLTSNLNYLLADTASAIPLSVSVMCPPTVQHGEVDAPIKVPLFEID